MHYEYDEQNRCFRDSEGNEISFEEAKKIRDKEIDEALNKSSSIEIRTYSTANEIMDDWIKRGWLHIP